MFCEKCGSQIEDGSLFCEACGAAVGAAEYVPPMQEMSSGAYAPVQPPMQAIPKKPMAKGMKLLLLEAGILLALIFAFYKAGEIKFSAERAAEQYFMAKAQGNWTQVYEMMDLPASKMLSKEMFLHSVKDSKLKDITNYKVSESSGKFSPMLKTFECEYMASGDSFLSTESIQLVKQKNKKWLLFDEWRVSPSDQLAEDCVVSIPRDAEALLEGISLEELAGTPNTENAWEKVYTLPLAFPGTYELEVTAPYRKASTTRLVLDSYYSAEYIRDMAVDGQILETVEPQCSQAIWLMFDNAVNGVLYEDFLSALGENITENFDSDYLYDSLRERLSQQEDEEYREITIDEISYEYSGSYTDGNTGNFQIRISAEMDCEYAGNIIDTDWWTGEKSRRPMEGWSDWFYFDIMLELVDGQWKIMEIY